MTGTVFIWIWTIVVPVTYVVGFGFAVDAIIRTRTPQGATAWALGLILMPIFALPLYWVFGRAKFDDYIATLRDFDKKVHEILAVDSLLARSSALKLEEPVNDRMAGELRAFTALTTTSFTDGNSVNLLMDGEDNFEAIFGMIDSAENYILAQFYTIKDDVVGRKFSDRLIAALGRGVRVYLLFDEVGSYNLGRSYKSRLRDAGAEVAGFSGNKKWLKRFRLNFRNHRKIVVADGRTGWTGGLNVGDQYLGHHERLSPWRDTGLMVEGPVVPELQYSFVRDWYYGQQSIPELAWKEPTLRVGNAPIEVTGAANSGLRNEREGGNHQALIVPSGPADRLETCGLLFSHAIESAEKRVWIASPYFVPDGRILGSLQLAALRGVDVRIIMPRMYDRLFFKYVPYAFFEDVDQSGVKVYLYEDGFMHQKVFVVDDDYAAVSTANLDNRSFLFNFEITCLVRGNAFARVMANMMEADMRNSSLLEGHALLGQSAWFRFAAKLTRLAAPIL